MKKEVERILLFSFSMFSLIGFIFGLEEAQTHYKVPLGFVSKYSDFRWIKGFNFFEFFQIWMVSSIPLIIQNICFICFRDKK
jgi:hypothetical protein